MGKSFELTPPLTLFGSVTSGPELINVYNPYRNRIYYLTREGVVIMFISMKIVFIQTNRQKVFRLVTLAVWLVSASVSLQPAWAADVCLTGVSNIGHHACCESATECPCEMKQDSSNEVPDQPIVPSSSFSNSANESLSPSIDSIPLVLVEEFFPDVTVMVTRGPSLKVYLRILNFLL